MIFLKFCEYSSRVFTEFSILNTCIAERKAVHYARTGRMTTRVLPDKVSNVLLVTE